MREIKLPSGAVLKVSPAPFSDAKKLYQALLREIKHLDIAKIFEEGNTDERINFFKDLFCSGFSSSEVEDCLWKCMARCQYGEPGFKVEEKTFDPIEARQDYVSACVEVALENVLPFMSGLFAQFSDLGSMIKPNQA